jgi:hypothetical protein
VEMLQLVKQICGTEIGIRAMLTVLRYVEHSTRPCVVRPYAFLHYKHYHSVQNLAAENHKHQNIRDYIILPVVLYGCQNWYRTLREEHRLRGFENGAEEDIWTEEG